MIPSFSRLRFFKNCYSFSTNVVTVVNKTWPGQIILGYCFNGRAIYEYPKSKVMSYVMSSRVFSFQKKQIDIATEKAVQIVLARPVVSEHITSGLRKVIDNVLERFQGFIENRINEKIANHLFRILRFVGLYYAKKSVDKISYKAIVPAIRPIVEKVTMVSNQKILSLGYDTIFSIIGNICLKKGLDIAFLSLNNRGFNISASKVYGVTSGIYLAVLFYSYYHQFIKDHKRDVKREAVKEKMKIVKDFLMENESIKKKIEESLQKIGIKPDSFCFQNVLELVVDVVIDTALKKQQA
jgi:hypothetical protein